MADFNLSLTRSENKEDNQQKFNDFVAYLHRGGKLAYIWTRFEGSSSGGDSYWWEVGVDPIPDISTPRKLHTYFSVHPLSEIPKTNKSGKPAESHRVRGRIIHVAAINSVYADLDDKDFGGRKGLLAHAKTISPKPSAVVDTGYGLHLYWFIDEPFPVYGNAANLKRAAALQYRWQRYTKSDPGAKDLARVLRVPGTDNWKFDTQRPCRFKRLDFSVVYTLAELEGYVADIANGEDSDEATEVKPIQNIEAEAKKAEIALSLLRKSRADNRDEWIEVGMSLAGLGDVGLGLWDAWSQQSDKYDAADLASKWKSFDEPENVNLRKPITLATLYYHARQDAADFSPEDEAILIGLLDEATDPQATIAQRRKAKAKLAERLIWYPNDVQSEFREEAKKKRWAKADFDKALDKATDSVSGKDEDEPETEDALRLSEYYGKFYPDSLRAGGEWFRYGNGVWQPRDDELIYREIVETALDVGIEVRRPTIEAAHAFAKAFAVHRDPGDWNPDSSILVVENGVLDISTTPPQFYEWSNQVYNRVRMPVVYDPNAKVKVYRRALVENLGGIDIVRFFLEFAGLSLAEVSRFEISPWLSGPPGGGKSTILAGLNAVLGDYAGPIDLTRLDMYAHGRVALIDKKVIYAYEVDTRFLTSPGTLNAIISHEPIQVNPKNKPEYTYTPRCSVIFAMNELPGVANPESGIFRRIKIVPIPGRDSKLHDPNIRWTIERDPVERSGMLNLFLEGLASVRKRGLVAYPQEVEEATRDWHVENDKVRLHILERCEQGNFSVPAAELYEDFRRWCRTSGLQPYGLTAWGKRMTALRFQRLSPESDLGSIAKTKSSGVIRYKGLRLKPQPSKTHEVMIDLARTGELN